MEQNTASLTPTQMVARQMRDLRKRRGMSAARLAERMTQVGVPWDRGIVAKLETGRRRTLGVDELLALAYVLDVAPMHLMVPLDNQTPCQITPMLSEPAWAVRRWIGGFRPPAGGSERRYFSEQPDGDWYPPGPMPLAQVDKGEPDEEAVRASRELMRRLVAGEFEQVMHEMNEQRQRAAAQEQSDG
jgi:transcriptional regulator with XRE-family HTH domain